MLSEKAPAEELDENNQKILQKIVGKFLYYDGSIDSTILMALNSLAAVQKNSTIKKFSKKSNKNQKVVQRNECIFLENKSHGKKS